jgi:hypothetical protein
MRLRVLSLATIADPPNVRNGSKADIALNESLVGTSNGVATTRRYVMLVLAGPPDRLRSGLVGADGLEPPTLSV